MGLELSVVFQRSGFRYRFLPFGVTNALRWGLKFPLFPAASLSPVAVTRFAAHLLLSYWRTTFHESRIPSKHGLDTFRPHSISPFSFIERCICQALTANRSTLTRATLISEPCSL